MKRSAVDSLQSSDDDATAVTHPGDRRVQAEDPPFTHGFLDKDPETSRARSLYFKIIAGTLLLVFTYVIWGVLPIYWGSVFKLYHHAHNLHGWIVDLDGGAIGQTVAQTFIGGSGPTTKMTWLTAPSNLNLTTREQFEHALVNEKAWAIVAINQGATEHLNQVLSSGNGPYNGTSAVTVYINEARSSNAVRGFVLPEVQMTMAQIEARFAAQQATRLGSSGSVSASLLTNAPLAVVNPLAYTLDNVRPFDSAIVTVVNFVGLIYVTIIAFVTVVANYNATTANNLFPRLTISTLITLRLTFYFCSYFVLSCFFSLLNLAFGTPFSRYFGSSGFVIYWVMAWVSMLALGLTLDAMIILLTVKMIPFFLIFWIVINVSIAAYPFELLPGVFRYGYAMPFYNLSRTVLTICFNTKNEIGMNFGIQIAWVVLNIGTITLFSIFVSKRYLNQYRKSQETTADVEKTREAGAV
ncbi:hypothetical protein BDM02DRAFT_1391636 [Thelephora ganbajun]|uniref:Uncharacterized protein n=1 Tax=Thelephora ganbajun TaxID=370292 RepID=A0ACB6ZLT6_THEGA|nr:hypothetical protein BDM02DRAFT_1391636 [Thelephora ganbajun]